MADIFGRAPLQFKGAFAADAAAINFGTGDPAFGSGVGLVTQSLQVSYQQPITRLYEVGTQYTYYVAGRPQGQINMARILGPGVVSTAFYQVFGNVCNADANHLTFDVATGCNTVGSNKGAMYFLANNVLLQSMGLSVAAQDMIINEQLSMFFTSLEAFDDALDLELACFNAFGTTCDGIDPFPPEPPAVGAA
jgi:hypothetical protein